MIKIKAVHWYELDMPLISPFQTAQGTYSVRKTLILAVYTEDGLVGYGECEAFEHPWYTSETVETEKVVLMQHIIPFLKSKSWASPMQFSHEIGWLKGHNFAKAGVEMALWDIYSQFKEQSIAVLIGGVRQHIEVGVVLGINEQLEQTYKQIEQYQQIGYKRYKIKIKPGKDESVIANIRDRYPDLPLMVDANSAYTLKDIPLLQRLDQYKLLMIEQPFGERDFVDHAVLQEYMQTPICLDESIHSLDDVKVAIKLKSCTIINVKLGRVGGLTEAKHIHDLCQQHNIKLWVGGMLESGIGRLHHIALASLAQFTIAGDISASNKYWNEDIIIPEVQVEAGNIKVPHQAGLAAILNEKQLNAYCVSKGNM